MNMCEKESDSDFVRITPLRSIVFRMHSNLAQTIPQTVVQSSLHKLKLFAQF